jgi:hypothetical protein
MNLLDVQQFETYVAACAANSGVTVQWDTPDSTPRTNGKTIFLPAITSKTSQEWLTRIRYFVKHETSHVVHSDFKFLNDTKPSGLLALINNLIEDHRIDYLNDMEFAGDKIISNEFWYLYADDVKSHISSADVELRKQQLLTLPLFVWDASLRDWITSSEEARAQMSVYIDADSATRLVKLAKYSDELITVRESGDAAQVLDLSERILRDLYDVDPESYKNQPEDGGGSATGKGEGGTDKDGKAIDDSVDRLINVDKLIKAMGHEHKPSRTGIHLKPQPIISGAYAIPNATEYVVCSFNKPIPRIVEDCMYEGHMDKTKVENYITSNAKPMATKLRIKLQTRSRDRYEYGKSKGKLHNGSLHRLVSGSDKHASKVFRQRVVSDTTDTAVCLLVDCSGSMSGKKFDMACAGAGALGEALKPSNINYSIYGFTNTVDEERPIIWLFNEFGEKVATSELVKRFFKVSGGLWQNSDGDAIAYATSKLAARKEHRKVLIVLSDGSPAGREHAGNIDYYTRQTVLTAEAKGIDVYGIGIYDNNVTRFYKKNVVVNDINELSPTILSVIDRSI